MRIFEELLQNSSTTDELENYLHLNIGKIYSLANSHYSVLINEKPLIRRFITIKRPIYGTLDFNKSQNKAFISILFDFCERFGLINTVAIEDTLLKRELYIGKRREAAKLFLLQIKEPQNYIDRFENICELLELAIELEEDNEKKSIVTFVNYYLKVLRDTSYLFINSLKEKTLQSRLNKTYNFLHDELINKILNIDVFESVDAENEIQKQIEIYLEHTEQDISEFTYFNEEIIIEKDSEYSQILTEIIYPDHISFSAIRNISVSRSDGRVFTGRGVNILETEEQMYSYMRRFGNMHKAKLDSAFEFLGNDLRMPINIIDWGCGQAIASMSLLDYLGTDSISSVILIEPSLLSLQRAALHLKTYNPELNIRTIGKKLDELIADDFPEKANRTTMHLFSNILDIDDYNQDRLFNIIQNTQSGENYFVCVSPFIDDVKTDRVDGFKRYFEQKYNTSFQLIGEVQNSKSSDDEYWHCNNNYNGNFNSQYCKYRPHKWCGCIDQWTRVIRVFKVKI